ncbi:MAG: isochorismatase family protein [Lentisphaeria bacterium]
MNKVLLVIDTQNDYFPGGMFPLWNTINTLQHIENAILQSKAKNIPVILIQHIADPAQGIAPFFNQNTQGAAIHPQIIAAANNAIIVVKHFADSFLHTNLEQILDRLNAQELLICGMMTQNCVTHTAISPSASKYKVTVMPDCCTTVSEMLHSIALHSISPRVNISSSTIAI